MRIGGYNYVTRPSPSTFNGAATFQLRIVCNGVSPLIFHSPSMEPQLFSCGLERSYVGGGTFSATFNGAATFQLRIVSQDFKYDVAGLPSMEPQLFSCGLIKDAKAKIAEMETFNGAATFQLRIVILSNRKKNYFGILQWSRNFSVADCKHILRNKTQESIQPSMEPQLFSCGLYDHKPNCVVSQSTFNGAATFQLRIA